MTSARAALPSAISKSAVLPRAAQNLPSAAAADRSDLRLARRSTSLAPALFFWRNVPISVPSPSLQRLDTAAGAAISRLRRCQPLQALPCFACSRPLPLRDTGTDSLQRTRHERRAD